MIWRLPGMALLMIAVLALPGCEPVHDPWVNNGRQWKERQFDTHAPDAQLRQRLWAGQTDR